MKALSVSRSMLLVLAGVSLQACGSTPLTNALTGSTSLTDSSTASTTVATSAATCATSSTSSTSASTSASTSTAANDDGTPPEPPTAADIATRMLAELDTDKSGELSLTEFLTRPAPPAEPTADATPAADSTSTATTAAATTAATTKPAKGCGPGGKGHGGPRDQGGRGGHEGPEGRERSTPPTPPTDAEIAANKEAREDLFNRYATAKSDGADVSLSLAELTSLITDDEASATPVLHPPRPDHE